VSLLLGVFIALFGFGWIVGYLNFMHPVLTVIGVVIIGVALRSCRMRTLRKLGMLVYLVGSGVALYFMTGSVLAGIAGMGAWFLLPWLELLTRVRRLRLPLNNKLQHRFPPNEDHFPNADAMIEALEEAGFEHAKNCGWDWAGASQSYQFYWHPEERCVAAVCFCQQAKITFSFVTFSSRDLNGFMWRTSNYPFAPTLKESPSVWHNQIGCGVETVDAMLASHHYFISLHGACHDDLCIPDPESVEEDVEQDMRRQIDYNLESGLIRLTGDGHFRYSFKGLFFLWKQFVKDMIRLC